MYNSIDVTTQNKIISGKSIADSISNDLKQEISTFDKPPHLVIIQIDDNPASTKYVSMKKQRAEEIGITVTLKNLSSEELTQEELIEEVKKLNTNPSVDGLMIQLPLPKGWDTKAILLNIAPQKDIDGLYYAAAGNNAESNGFPPAVATGIVTMLQAENISLGNKSVVIINTTWWLGTPLARLLKSKGAIITQCDENTPDIKSVTQQADILITATGQPHLIDDTYIKEGAIIIDVGTAPHPQTGKIVGDVNFEKVIHKCSKITPVPGGVGPMTVISLLQQTVTAYKQK
jgi:methylenetetrahydrofolate dehydrogenase (NADP+)/methenyltetrahydrofolate cyclohydrolase